MKKLILILAVIIGFTSLASSREISGTVKDETGNVIPGVTVLVENTSRGTVTDIHGFYKISVQPEDKALVFSFVGMDTKKVKIGSKDKVDVVLKAFKLGLEECVVIAYGTQKAAMDAAISTPPAMKRSFIARQPEFNTENYSSIHENGYKDVFNHPLSTFSIDVDQASYSNVRRFLNLGQMPPMDAVRIEEMINYFNYDYQQPKNGTPYSINTELTNCPWNSDHQLLMVGLQAKKIDKSMLPPSNLVFLLDVSGSMQAPNKLPLVKSAMRMLLNELRPTDRVAIVVYAGAAGTALSSTPGNEKQKIEHAIQQLEAGGSTAGGAGLQLAYKIARENFIEDGNNRIILATDGDFNLGVSSTSEMERLVEKERESGVFMTVLGFGTGNYKDDKMETIADKGNGNYAYIDNLQEARKVFIQEFGGTLFTVAKDVKLQLEFNPYHVKAYRLIGYENRLLNDEDFKNDKKDAGEMGMGHTVTALYEIIPSKSEEQIPEIDELKYQQRKKEAKPKLTNELVTVKTRYKLPDGNKSIPFEQVVSSEITPLQDSSDNIRFASAVAGFGMLLRDSEYKGTLTYERLTDLAKHAKANDEDGYRSEFVLLVNLAENLDQSQAEK
ncbi:YfbK domain-containing protein [Sunxiuqinia sp. A32]|uniref:YfbK domain-containing protein n=1 Tax=Sunxiuqinia sp. A32 TaxID=3461496 RepID=UPI0040460738